MRRNAALVLVVLAAYPAASAAQVSPVGDGQEALATLVAAGMTGGNAPSCLERPMAMRATLARVTAGNPGLPWNTEVPKAAWPALELLADQVAHEVRARLGARDGELATPPDSSFQWRRLGGHVHVTAYRQGRTRWWLSGEVAGHAKWRDTSGLAAERLLGAALDSVLSAGGEWWPAEFEGDSLPFLLRFSWPIAPWFSAEGQGRDPLVGAVARIEVPTYTPVAQVREPRIAYPSQAADAGIRATIALQFLVDSTGKVVPESVKDIWPEGKRRPAGDLGRHYNHFVRNARNGVVGAEYTPAMLGGCRVPQLVQQPFVFELNR